MAYTNGINAGIVGDILEVENMRKRSSQDKTIISIKERINTPVGYKIITTSQTRHDKNLLDIFIDFFS